MTEKQLLYDLKNVIIEYRDSIGMGDTTFGVEIEAEGNFVPKIRGQYDWVKFIDDVDSSEFSSLWLLKPDASFKKERILGSEISSPILKDSKNDWNEIKQTCDLIKQCGGRIGNCCGGHIHFGENTLTNGDPYILINLLRLWAVFEDVIFMFSTGEFINLRKSIYENCCPLARNIKHVLDGVRYYDLSFKDILSNLCTFNGAFRVEQLKRYYIDDDYLANQTIEVRCPNGSLEPAIWQNNINFFYHLFNYACSMDFDEDLIGRMYNELDFSKICSPSMVIENYKLNIKKAVILSNLIFTDEIDKLYFLKQVSESANEGNSLKKALKFYL